MPQLYPVNANTMNYAGPIMGGVVLFSGIWYLIYGVCLCSQIQVSYVLMDLYSQWRTYKPAAAVVGGLVRSPEDVNVTGQRRNSDSAVHRGSWDEGEK